MALLTQVRDTQSCCVLNWAVRRTPTLISSLSIVASFQAETEGNLAAISWKYGSSSIPVKCI